MKKEQSFWVAVFTGFVILVAGDILVHQFLLKETYRELAHFWRPASEMKEKMWVPFLAAFSLAYLLALIYPKGVEGKAPWEEGARFGLQMGLLIYLPAILTKYYVYPYPTNLLAIWFISGVTQVTLAGAGIAHAYKKKK